MGLRERIWTTADCLHATVEWNVSWSTPRDRCGDGGLRRASHDRIPTAPPRRSTRGSTPTTHSSVDLYPAFGLCLCTSRALPSLKITSSETTSIAASTG